MNKLALVVILLLPSFSLFGQGPCKKLYAPANASFTVCPPASLHESHDPDLQFSAFSNGNDKVPTSLAITVLELVTKDSIRESAYDALLEEYTYPGRHPDLKEMGEFKTDGGIPYIRLLYEATGIKGRDAGERDVRLDYFFQGPGVLVAFTVAAHVGAVADVATADAMIKTVTIKQK